MNKSSIPFHKCVTFWENSVKPWQSYCEQAFNFLHGHNRQDSYDVKAMGNYIEYLLIFQGHFAVIEFETEFVKQMQRHLRVSPAQRLLNKMFS